MNERLHAGIAVLFVVATLAVRWAVTPVRQPAPYDGDITVVTPIAEFMGEWEQEPVYGIALELARGEGS